MEWRTDLGPARAGDTGAVERLREYLTPFAHGVLLAHAPHHLAEGLTPRVLDYLLGNLSRLTDAQVAPALLQSARDVAKKSAGPRIEERSSPDAALLEARQTVIRLRAVPEQPRERLLLRLVEGVPGPEIAEVLGLKEAELRPELERAAEAASRQLMQTTGFGGDSYLWDLTGSPPPLLAKLEMQLPMLRYGASASGSSLPNLPRIEGGPVPMSESLSDATAVGADALSTTPGVPVTPAPEANPFEGQAHTIAATDLPAEAQALYDAAAEVPRTRTAVPGPEEQRTGTGTSPARSGRFSKLPDGPRPVPQPGSGERSGKSGKSASGKSAQKLAPAAVEVTREAGAALPLTDNPATEVRVPSRLGMVFEPTAPTGDALDEAAVSLGDDGPGETRVLAIPVEERGEALRQRLEDARTATTGDVPQPWTPPPPLPPGWLKGATFKGITPLIIAGGLLTVALIFGYSAVFAADKSVRAAWQLAQVVVAAEDLNLGDAITTENVALRAVSEPFHGSGVVKAEAVDSILGQRVTVAVQEGDPLFFSQFLSTRLAQERLSRRVLKRGRGYSIAASEEGLLARQVHSGDEVDVLVTFKMPNEHGQRRSATLLQKVRVLATGKMIDTLPPELVSESHRRFNDVTLLLTPEEAEALTLATAVGSITLTLRNEEDVTSIDYRHTSINTLLDGERNRKVHEKRFKTIQLIRGGGAAVAAPKD